MPYLPVSREPIVKRDGSIDIDLLRPIQDVDYEGKNGNQQRFEAFHNANPHILQVILGMSLSMKERSDNGSMSQIFEVLRWNYSIRTNSKDGFKLANAHRAYYARLVMALEPSLQDPPFFKTVSQRNPYSIDWEALGIRGLPQDMPAGDNISRSDKLLSENKRSPSG